MPRQTSSCNIPQQNGNVKWPRVSLAHDPTSRDPCKEEEGESVECNMCQCVGYMSNMHGHRRYKILCHTTVFILYRMTLVCREIIPPMLDHVPAPITETGQADHFHLIITYIYNVPFLKGALNAHLSSCICLLPARWGVP